MLDAPAMPPAEGRADTSITTSTASNLFDRIGLVGTSPAMRRLHAEILRYAPRTATVLVQGETGTGKELVARALHTLSPRSAGPFVAVNVATLRGEMLASELFGHERGAFTGAIGIHRGVFEQAHGGTLFMDEIGELDVRAQADLLRVLETGEVRRLGSERTCKVDFRLVAATHRDLATLVREGSFREDLFYRLHVLPIEVPPLRQRSGDLFALVKHLLERLEHDVGVRFVTPACIRMMAAHPWPGNVRQLLNVLRRATAITDARVIDHRTIAAMLDGGPAPVIHYARPAVGAEDVTQALRLCDGNKTKAAKTLGVPRSTLRGWLSASEPARSGRQLKVPA